MARPIPATARSSLPVGTYKASSGSRALCISPGRGMDPLIPGSLATDRTARSARGLARTSDNLEKLIMAAVLALTCVIAWSTFALAIFLARMTRTILRAIHRAGESGPPGARSHRAY